MAEKITDIPENIAALLSERQQARTNKDWSKSDVLRQAIYDAGYLVEDGPEGQSLKLK